MTEVRGCHLPDHLLYDVEHLVWYADQGDGTVKAGLTTIATALSGPMLAFTPKRPTREFEKGKSFATIESGKWVGPARAAFDGVVVAINEAMMERPTIGNREPYGDGYMMIVKPSSLDWAQGLTGGLDIAPAFEAWMEREGFKGCAPDE